MELIYGNYIWNLMRAPLKSILSKNSREGNLVSSPFPLGKTSLCIDNVRTPFRQKAKKRLRGILGYKQLTMRLEMPGAP